MMKVIVSSPSSLFSSSGALVVGIYLQAVGLIHNSVTDLASCQNPICQIAPFTMQERN